MTSRNLFFNLLKEDFRRRLWTFILASLVFFGTFPIVFTMMLQSWVSDYTNNGFLQRAFKDAEQNAIVLKEVDNSASTIETSSNEYACENTFDKIYLLSYQDMYNANYGFSSSTNESETKCAKVTDYAKAVGASWSTSVKYLDNGYYWLRSPDYSYVHYANYVDYDGYVYSNYVYNSYYGVRVACTINLE